MPPSVLNHCWGSSPVSRKKTQDLGCLSIVTPQPFFHNWRRFADIWCESHAKHVSGYIVGSTNTRKRVGDQWLGGSIWLFHNIYLTWKKLQNMTLFLQAHNKTLIGARYLLPSKKRFLARFGYLRERVLLVCVWGCHVPLPKLWSWHLSPASMGRREKREALRGRKSAPHIWSR